MLQDLGMKFRMPQENDDIMHMTGKCFLQIATVD